jgi:hypothetical protein
MGLSGSSLFEPSYVKVIGFQDSCEGECQLAGMFPAFFLLRGCLVSAPITHRYIVWAGPAPRLKFFVLMDTFYRDVRYVMDNIEPCSNTHNRWVDQETRWSLEMATAHLSSIGEVPHGHE